MFSCPHCGRDPPKQTPPNDSSSSAGDRGLQSGPRSRKNHVATGEARASSRSEPCGCGEPLVVTPLPLSLLPSVPDAISSTNPRVIDDARARKLSSDLKRCTYYETCATYGLNVERVFQDGERCRGDPGAASPAGGGDPAFPRRLPVPGRLTWPPRSTAPRPARRVVSHGLGACGWRPSRDEPGAWLPRLHVLRPAAARWSGGGGCKPVPSEGLSRFTLGFEEDEPKGDGQGWAERRTWGPTGPGWGRPLRGSVRCCRTPPSCGVSGVTRARAGAGFPRASDFHRVIATPRAGRKRDERQG